MALTSMLTPCLSSFVVGAHRRGCSQVAPRIDAPAPCARRQLAVDLPAVRARGSLVLGARALQRHAAAVVADRADRIDLLGGQLGAAAHRGQLVALVLDRARAG